MMRRVWGRGCEPQEEVAVVKKSSEWEGAIESQIRSVFA